MFQRFRTLSIPYLGGNSAAVAGLIGLNLAFNILANSSFRMSAASTNWRGFITWQVVGNLAGFITVLTLTGLLKHLSLSIAYPVTMGLAIIGVQLVAAKWLFHEAITPHQWLGTLFIITGIWLIQR